MPKKLFGNCNSELASLTRLTFDGDTSIVKLHKALNYGKTYTNPYRFSLICPWNLFPSVKYLVLMLKWYSNTCVNN